MKIHLQKFKALWGEIKEKEKFVFVAIDSNSQTGKIIENNIPLLSESWPE